MAQAVYQMPYATRPRCKAKVLRSYTLGTKIRKKDLSVSYHHTAQGSPQTTISTFEIGNLADVLTECFSLHQGTLMKTEAFRCNIGKVS